jgi:ABC-type sugar transport system substrate-binding protein
MRAHRTTGALAFGVTVALLIGACSAGSSPGTSAAPTAAGESASTGDMTGKKIAWVMWGTDGYQQGQGASFKQLGEAEGAEVNLIDGKNDPLVQAKAIDDLIAAGIDGIVWQPADPAAAVEPAKAIRAAGIPLVFVGVQPDASSGVAAPTVPFGNMFEQTKAAGAAAATFVKENLNQTPKVVLYDLVALPLCHDERMTGFMDGVKSVAPDAETVFWDTVPTTKDGTTSKMEDQLQANPDFNIFTGCGGDLILGGIAGLQAAGRAQAVDKVPQTEWILTIDGTPAEVELLLDPTTSIMQTLMQTPFENGEIAWRTMTQVLSGEIAADSATLVDTPPALALTKDMTCQEVAEVFERQYGLTEIYQPLDCS